MVLSKLASSTVTSTVTPGDERIDIYDLTGPKPVGKPGPLHTGKAEALAWHSDGRLAVAGGPHHEVRLWDLTEPTVPQMLVACQPFSKKVLLRSFWS